ncbi:DNA alkylation repair protein [Youngiibacter fragilis]|uniref:DNA alkylation repair enzyme n=1 Tax=Youngiibacter fragilis 232.1 TaxID=994573 RepID=V7HYI6_9CLOT|nr:DNA alkylation repair protein [Youngiibacter fragilis]ETA79045.1 DNA alkylation repair enzyme [Youngiibacter fragilis 232.1]
MVSEIRNSLLESAEERYREFTSKLLPGTGNILGVRLPKLRKIAKEIAKSDWRPYVESEGMLYYEETMLQGMVIGYADAVSAEKLELSRSFIPRIDNWGVCDSFCSGLKFTAKNPSHVWDFIQPYAASSDEFESRFASVMMLNYYITEEYIDRVLTAAARPASEGYYATAAAAWTLSVCYVRFPEKTFSVLYDEGIDETLRRMAIRKIIESRQVTEPDKELVRKLRKR